MLWSLVWKVVVDTTVDILFHALQDLDTTACNYMHLCTIVPCNFKSCGMRIYNYLIHCNEEYSMPHGCYVYCALINVPNHLQRCEER